MSVRSFPLGVFLGLALWAAVLGWLVSPWLEMFGLVVLLLLSLSTIERRKP